MMPTPVKYLDHLLKDPLLVPLLTDAEPRELKPVSNSAFYLYSTIIRQQLSTRVGNVLLERFLNIYGGHEPTPAGVTTTPLETLQSIGLSRQKASYIKNVAQFDQEHGLGAEKLNAMTDAEVTAYITEIKGIGRWTANLFLMAALGREDVFPSDDLILQKAIAGIYNLDRADKKQFLKLMESISEKWSPYRSYASLHLWRWKPEEGQ